MVLVFRDGQSVPFPLALKLSGEGRRRLALRLLEDNPEVAWVRDGKEEVRRPADEAALRWLMETE